VVFYGGGNWHYLLLLYCLIHGTLQEIDAESAYSICLPLSQTLKRFAKLKKYTISPLLEVFKNIVIFHEKL
jgi:hypothetical protein